MGKFCLYSDSIKDAPCIMFNTFKYSYISDFFSDNKGSKKKFSVPVNIECIKKLDSKVGVVNERCINCMFCLFGCTGNRILISKEIHPSEMCVDVTRSEIEDLRTILLPSLFRGEFIHLKSVPYSSLKVKYKNFDSFTAVDETKNIAVWGANAMKYLSLSLEPRLSLEVGVDIATRDRGGRLDISLLNTNENKAFFAETKVSFKKMIDEGRYVSQMLAYERELASECPVGISYSLFLLIGDKESDLLPSNHPRCSSDKNKSLFFYDTLRKHKLFFVSANSLLALGLMKMFVSCEKYNLEMLELLVHSGKYIGLLSSGVITSDLRIVPLDFALDNI